MIFFFVILFRKILFELFVIRLDKMKQHMKRLFEFVGLHNLELSFLFVFVNVENSIEIRVVLAMEIVGTS